MALQVGERKCEGRRDQSVTKGWTEKYRSVPSMEMEKKEKTRKSMLPRKPSGES